MSWDTLQAHALSMGFEVAFRTRRDQGGGFMPDLTPPKGRGWIFVGSYENAAGFWVKPLTDGTRKLHSNFIRKLMLDCDPFIGTFGDDDVDYFNSHARLLVALQGLDQFTGDQPEHLRSGTIRNAGNLSTNKSAELMMTA
ncbi:protein of unknown function [Georgfuchsia toluolica]|uniref:Uncharacterized protein n=1 Tax=Georgfuchsia toluolica TaxID=424218 RepID=A0A916MZP2_9PROT|nr:hypothetical protein [Georgfuchsia toluolica]CAG4883133.1 protein of unknown function [Georgfuchsia toluolica]